MLTFDKITIIVSDLYISNIDPNRFECKSKNGQPISYTFHQKIPYHLYIKDNIEKRKLTIEFTSKILLDEARNLINAATIYNCFLAISRMGICDLDFENIMRFGQICKCDVTKDIYFDLTELPSLVTNIGHSLNNNLRWKCERYCNGGGVNGVVIHNSATTRRHKSRLCIYSKSKELEKTENKRFRRSLQDRKSFLDYYSNKLRFELNLISMSQIRRYLNIKSVDIMSVLEASPDSNPIYQFLDKVLIDMAAPIPHLTQRDNERMALIRENGCDISRVESAVRRIKSPSVAISRAMKPYRRLLATVTPPQPTKRMLLGMVA